jgi:phosphoribosylamine-glycine ligase
MRIFFNRGFSLAPIAKAMMAADPSLAVYISTGEGMPSYDGATATVVEPSLPNSEYLAWVEHQITANQIDIFIPTRKRALLATTSLPCRVEMPGAPEVLALLEDKHAFAAALTDQEFHLPTLTANGSQELRDALEQFRQTARAHAIACVKPRHGVNGHGFWKFDAKSPTSHLLDPDSRSIQPEMFLAAMEAEERCYGQAKPVVLMEFLPGPEVSFDVLAYQGSILRYIARTKLEDRQHLQSSHSLEPAARELVRRFNLTGVVNVQFRKAEDGSWKVLEINARPAGGSVYAEQFGGRLLADWAGLLTGRIGANDVDQTSIDLEIAFESKLALVG